MKIIIYNYDLTQSILNFFDVFNVHPKDENKIITSESLPRILGSNENFEPMENSEATWYINQKTQQGFYKEDSLNICRYYNPKVYPNN